MVEVTISAARLLRAYFNQHPEELAKEEREAGVNPIAHPEQYLTYELTREPVHHDVEEAAQRRGGVVTENLLRRWIFEEETIEPREHEHARRERRPPSICPECHREFVLTGRNPGGLCNQCVRRSATWAAPPRAPPEFWNPESIGRRY